MTRQGTPGAAPGGTDPEKPEATGVGLLPGTPERAAGSRSAARPWQILCALAVSGFLLALPGGLLPLWGYHISPEFGMAGNYFLFLGVGIAAGGALAQRLAVRIALDRLLAFACGTSALAIVMIAFASPPAQLWYQAAALLIAGFSAGVVNTAVFEGASCGHEPNPASITLAGGIFFGAGSVLAALVMTQSFERGGLSRPLLFAAIVPASAAFWYHRRRIVRIPVIGVSLDQSVRDLRSTLAILFALLLFFQFANEWLIAGWLPVFLIDRMGMSPATAVDLLAVYWIALTAGRIGAAKLLPLVRHGRLLGLSAFCALFGCSLIAYGSRAGVVVGLLLTGAGFSAIYPLAAERIASRFSYYHPGYFNGIFTFALMGGILAPFAAGHVAMVAGLNAIPVGAMAGSCAVFTLVLLIFLGREVSGR